MSVQFPNPSNWSDERWAATWNRINKRQQEAERKRLAAMARNNPQAYFQHLLGLGHTPQQVQQMMGLGPMNANQMWLANAANQANANVQQAKWNAAAQSPFVAQRLLGGRGGWGGMGSIHDWMWNQFQQAPRDYMAGLDNMNRLQDQNLARMRENEYNRATLWNLEQDRKLKRDIYSQMLDNQNSMTEAFSDALPAWADAFGKGLSGINWFNTAGGQGARDIDGATVTSEDIPAMIAERRSGAPRFSARNNRSSDMAGVSDVASDEITGAIAGARRSGDSRFRGATGSKHIDARTKSDATRAGVVSDKILDKLGLSTEAKRNTARNEQAAITNAAIPALAQQSNRYKAIGALANTLFNTLGGAFNV